jgi:hypothetical protein
VTQNGASSSSCSFDVFVDCHVYFLTNLFCLNSSSILFAKAQISLQKSKDIITTIRMTKSKMTKLLFIYAKKESVTGSMSSARQAGLKNSRHTIHHTCLSGANYIIIFSIGKNLSR